MRELSRLRWCSGVQWGNKGGAISGGMLQALPRKKKETLLLRGVDAPTLSLCSLCQFSMREYFKDTWDESKRFYFSSYIFQKYFCF